MSDDGNYELDFLSKEALLSRDIDFQQSLVRDLVGDGSFRETNGRSVLAICNGFIM